MHKYSLIILFFCAGIVQAQQNRLPVSGVVTYQQKLNLIFLVIQKDTLRFNRTKSIFHWNTANWPANIGSKGMKDKFPNAKPGKGSIKLKSEIFYGTRINLYDTSTDSLFSLVGMRYINKLLYLKEEAPKIDWSIQDSTKKIGNYEVKKATARFRGRDYTAWFSPKIPVPYGPWKLHGLPGSILKTYDKSGNIYYSATNITTSTNDEGIDSIALDGSEQVVTLAEYKEIFNNFDKYQKQNLMKMVRPYLSEKEMANMTFMTQPVKHMEIFETER